MKSSVTQDLVFKFLSGTATALEQRRIEEWLRQEDGMELYHLWVEEWERAHPQFTPHTDQAWLRWKREILAAPMTMTAAERQPAHQTKVPLRNTFRHAFRHTFLHSFRFALSPSLIRSLGFQENDASHFAPPFAVRHFVMAACVCLVLAGGAAVVWNFFGGREAVMTERITTGNGEVRTIALADGSTVTLNANTELSVPRFGFTNDRRLELRGEAEFSVVHTATHAPFVVRTARGMDVRVLGTEFTVFSRERGEKVALMSGKVEVEIERQTKSAEDKSSLDNKNTDDKNTDDRNTRNDTAGAIVLKPGDVLRRAPEGQIQVKAEQRVGLTHTAWKHKMFFFDNTRFEDIAEQIYERFGVQVRIDNQHLAARELSGSYPADDPNKLLRALSEALQCSVRREQDLAVFW